MKELEFVEVVWIPESKDPLDGKERGTFCVFFTIGLLNCNYVGDVLETAIANFKTEMINNGSPNNK